MYSNKHKEGFTMTNVLLVLSSVRESRAADKILEQVEVEFAKRDNYQTDVADFKATPLPFFDSPLTPSAEGFVAANENVQKWTEQVAHADMVIFLASENNYSYTAVLKNAIDWIGKEWTDKPVAFVGYGWTGGSKAIAELRNLMTGFIKAVPNETDANLAFMKDIDLTGAATSGTAAEKINTLIDSL